MSTLVMHPRPIGLEILVGLTGPASDPFRLLVEDGTGVVGANSYVTLAYANNYFIGRRLYSSAWTVAANDLKEAALRMASAYLDYEFIWTGTTAVNPNQGLAWPFTDAYDRYNRSVTGVPGAVKDATCELAFYLLAEDRLVDQQGVGLKSVKVDSIEIVFDKSESTRTFPPFIARMLLGLGSATGAKGSIRNVKLFRV